MTTIEDVLKEAVDSLHKAGLPEARSEAEFLVAALLNRSRARLILDRRERLVESQLKILKSGIAKRSQRWPLAYITHDQPFRDLVLRVTPDVLIPRPETEEFVETILERIRSEKRPVTAADIGTGSGCIAISLAHSPWVTRVWGIDRSAKALAIARGNASRHYATKKCKWKRGHLGIRLIQDSVNVDFLIANLPYVATRDMLRLQPEVGREPISALEGGKDGLDLIFELIMQAPKLLHPSGWLMLEIGIHQDKAVQKRLQKQSIWDHIQIHEDLSGIPRFVQAQLKG